MELQFPTGTGTVNQFFSQELVELGTGGTGIGEELVELQFSNLTSSAALVRMVGRWGQGGDNSAGGRERGGGGSMGVQWALSPVPSLWTPSDRRPMGVQWASNGRSMGVPPVPSLSTPIRRASNGRSRRSSKVTAHTFQDAWHPRNTFGGK